MANNSEYKVKVGVEFNAIMNDVDSKLAQLKEDIKAVGNAGGNKQFLTGFQEDVDKLVAKLNKLRETEITPGNFNRFQAELSSITDDITKAKGKMDEFASNSFGEKITTQQNEINRLNTAIDGYTSTITTLQKKQQDGEQLNNEEIKQLQEAIDNRTKAQRSLNGHLGALAKLQNQQRTYNNAVQGSEQILEGAAKAVDELDKESKEYLATREKLANEKVARTIETQVNRFIGLNAVLRYSKKYIQDLVKTYKEFDESLVAIAAVTGQTRDQMWANIGVYNKMAQSLGTTTQEVINASKLYYQQGLTTTSVLKLTEETVKLATIAELDSADATEYLTTAMNGFKLSAEESTRVTDVWANLAAKTASDVDELAIAISKVASLAENAGMEIETASAFLNQMIETTREAPENLGTALKTIIARFQELKVSEEALSDGVDANKVERALKSAGVALRDVDGQFRDFDDVILDLSAKWNTLDRNTQRYIATIAAGSRQQSRFIALVSDYEGLVRNVNYAYDSLGSADAQMTVFQEGLTASTNRLKAAWEGLYTSWSESATVISKLIDGAADFVSTLADLGAGTSALLALGGLLIARILAGAAAREIEAKGVKSVVAATRENTRALLENALATAIANGADATQIATLKTLIEKTAKYTAEEEANTFALIKNAAASGLIVLKYAAIAAVLALVLYAIIKLVNYENEHIKVLEKKATAARQAAAQTKDQASSLEVLGNELDQVRKAGEDEAEVRQKLLDQFGPTIKNVDVLTGSYKELREAIEDVVKEQNSLAAAQYLDAYFKEQDEAVAKAKAKVKEIIEYDKDAFGSGPMDTYEAPVGRIKGYEYNGKVYNKKSDAIAAAEADAKSELDSNRAIFIADSLINAEGLKSDVIDINSLIQGLIQNSGDNIQNYFSGIIRGENGVITSISGFNKDFIAEITNLIPELENSGFAEQFNALFNGSLNGLSFDMINQLINELRSSGASEGLISYFQNMSNELQAAINQGFQDIDVGFYEYTIRSNLLPGAQKAFIDTFSSLGDDPQAQQAYAEAISKLIHTMNPEDITGAMVEALGDMDSGIEAFKNLINASGELKDESLLAYFNSLRESIGQNNAVFTEGKAVVDSYYDSMEALGSLQEGKMSNEDYLAKLQSEAALLAEVNGLNEQVVLSEMLKATTIDESGNMVLKLNDYLKQLINTEYESSATTVEGKKAELNAYADMMEAVADELDNLANETEDKITSAKVSEDVSKLMVQHAVGVAESENKMGAAADKAWQKVRGKENTSAYEAVNLELEHMIEGLNAATSADDIRRLATEARAKALDARAKAAQLSIGKLASTFDKAGKSAGSAAKETDKYKEALKELQDQLKEAEDEAKKYIDAILDYLKEQKEATQEAIDAAEDALEKERDLLKIQLEAWKEYLEQRQKENQDALDLQGQAAAEYFKAEIEGIQAKIDALDKEAEAEDRILKLQKARDEYNRAQNSRTRLVLTKGAGWIFKSDQKQITDARKALNDVQREIQKVAYQDQINELQKQADEWAKIAEGITKSAEEIAKLAAAVDKFRQGMEAGGTGYADVGAYDTAVTAQQDANDEYQRQLEEVEKWLEQADWSYQDYMDDQARQQFLQEFMDGTVGEQDLQEKVTAYLQDMLKTEAYIEEQKKLIEKIEKIEAAYELEKAQLGLTKQQLKEAKKIRKAIEKAFDPESGDLGLGKGSSYYQEVVAPLVETVQKIAEELAKLEAEQGNGSSNGGGSGSGSSSSDGGGENQGTTTTSPGTTPGTTPGETSGTDGGNESSYSCNHNWVYDSITDTMIRWRCTKCGATKTEAIIGKGKREGPGEEDRGTLTPKPSIPSPPTIGTRGIGLPSMSTLSTSTPSLNKVTNTSSTTTINIGTLESSANDYNGLVNDLMRNSMIKQPI